MDWRVKRVNEVDKGYDRRLFAMKDPRGPIIVFRKPDRLDASDYDHILPDSSVLPTQFIFALTEDWSLKTPPVEQGLEPVYRRLLYMDAWRDDGLGQRLREGRERAKEEKKQSIRNEIRAMAYDIRRDFAKATDDVNTSTVEKVDPRRKNGNC